MIQHQHPSSTSTNNALLLFIAFVTFWFVVLKMPMELQVTSRAASSRLTMDDWYNKRAPRSAVDQRMDAQRSYHFFNRRRSDTSLEQIHEDQKLAYEVDKIMRHHYSLDDPEERRNLRSGVDKTTVSERVKEIVRQYLDRNDGATGAKKRPYIGGIPQERKEEDPYDIEITKEIQDIVNEYRDPDEI